MSTQKIIRFFIFFIVFFIFLNSLFFIGIGVYKSIHAYILIVQGRIEERPGVFIAESLDSFLMALFFLIFAMGISKLFLPNKILIKEYDLPWLKVDNFSELKFILWEVLLTTLFVYFSTQAIIKSEHLDWSILTLPISILLLAVAYKFLKHGH
jgi:uncharacterized membrane protein YqhA